MPTVNEQLQDEAIKHSVYAVRLAGGMANKIVGMLNKVDDDIIRQLKLRAPESGVWTTARLNALLNSVRKINKKVYNLIGKELKTDLKELAVYEAEFKGTRLHNAFPVALDVTTPNVAVLHAVVTAKPFQGRLLSEWVDGLDASRYNKLQDAIRIGVIEGETVDAIARRVRGTKALNFKDGVLDIGRRQAQALTRTAVNHTMTAASEALYKQNEDVVKGVKWVSTLDGKTTPICQRRDGKVYPVDEGARPPAHIGCRSTTAPITRSWRELGVDLDEAPPGTRASMNGQVPADATYPEWFDKQSAPLQDGVLGKTKGKLYRRGNAPLGIFSDQVGHESTLAERKGPQPAEPTVRAPA